MLLSRSNGATSVILNIKILDSTVTTGAGKTGLSSASTGLIIAAKADVEATTTAYTVAGSTIETITTIGTYAAPTATKCRFKEIDATNHPGAYELQFADARFAVSGAKSLLVSLSGVTGMAQTDFVVDLQAGADVRYYLGSAVPAADTAGYPKVTIKSGTGTGEASLSSGVIQAALTTASRDATAGAVFDVATASHLQTGSFGAALAPTEHGTAQAGGASTITLRSGAVATDAYYAKQLLRIVAGTGAGQSEYISSYVGATKVATMGAAWAVPPDNTSVYEIIGGGTIPGASAPTASQVASAVMEEAMSGHTTAGSFGEFVNAAISRTGTAQAGTTTSITLDAGASATNNLYRYHNVEITGGTGAGEVSFITGYTGSSKVASVDPPFAVAPDATSKFALRKFGIDAATPTQVATAVWAATRAANATAGTFGEYVNADGVRIAGSATAATNAKSAFDGATGYGFTNCTMPTTTAVTNTVTANATLTNGVHGGAAATLTLKSVAVSNSDAGGIAVDIVGSGTGNSHALRLQSTNGHGLAAGSTNGNAINAASTSAEGMKVSGGTNKEGLLAVGNGTASDIKANINGTVSVADKTGFSLSTTGIDALFTRALTESYAADGAAPTVAQSLMLIQQMLGDFSITGTTLTVNKLDGITAAGTFTLNSSSAPTSLTRAT